MQRHCEYTNGETITLSDYLKRMRQTGICAAQILGEGGMGKSSSLLALWNELNSEMAEIPLMIPLHEINLCPKEHADTFILRYLCENYFFKYSDAAIQSQYNHLKSLFSKKTERHEYMLLLDGFNEVTNAHKFCIARQIIELIACDNIKLFIASRQHMGNYLCINNIDNIILQPLQSDTISAYIRSCGQNPDDAESVQQLLRTPMLLTVYCETTKIVALTKESDLLQYLIFDTNVHKKGELISNYMESLAAKRFLDASKKEEEPKLALVQELWMYYFVLPKIAWIMVQRQLPQWEKTKDLLDVLSTIQISSTEARDWFRKRCLLNSWLDVQERMSPPNRQDAVPENILSYLESWPTIFVKRKYWEFIHQDYQDFCAARFLFYQMEGDSDSNECDDIPDDILLFVGDIYNGYKQ